MKNQIVRTLHPRRIIIIGSTGSIGRQTLEVIENQPQHFKVAGLACHKNVELLAEQILKFQPEAVAVYKKEAAQKLKKILKKLRQKRLLESKKQLKKSARADFKKTSHFRLPKILFGPKSFEQLVDYSTSQKISHETTKIVFAGNGLTALPALYKAIKLRKEISLASKELIVAEGEKIMATARKNKVTIIPIDSEHSAIFQCLQGEDPANIEKIILTCSGGPFYGKSQREIENVTLAQALQHPTWNMGQKISIDSATLMNKGFEMIEAKHLFNLRDDQIEIVIHPESIVHSFVVFKDGNVKAQLSTPDMRIPITYALAYPQRLKTEWPCLDFAKLQKLTFIKPDFSVLRGVSIAQAVLKKSAATHEAHTSQNSRRTNKNGGQSTPKSALKNHAENLLKKMVLANEKAVKKFLAGKIKFLEIYKEIQKEVKID